MDVGAFDGIYLSNSYALELNGWQGICVEPQHDIYGFLEKQRPNSINVNVACGASESEMELLKDETGLLSHLSSVGSGLSGETLAEKQLVRVTSLDVILGEHHIEQEPLDVVTIDVEGAELQVLAGFDFGRWSPALCVIEANNSEAAELLDKHMIEQGYLLSKTLRVNRFYTRDVEMHERVQSIDVSCVIARQLHPKGIELTDSRIASGKIMIGGQSFLLPDLVEIKREGDRLRSVLVAAQSRLRESDALAEELKASSEELSVESDALRSEKALLAKQFMELEARTRGLEAERRRVEELASDEKRSYEFSITQLKGDYQKLLLERDDAKATFESQLKLEKERVAKLEGQLSESSIARRREQQSVEKLSVELEERQLEVAELTRQLEIERGRTEQVEHEIELSSALENSLVSALDARELQVRDILNSRSFRAIDKIRRVRRKRPGSTVAAANSIHASISEAPLTYGIHHRHGWDSIAGSLIASSDHAGPLLEPFLESRFAWPTSSGPFEQPWFGIAHVPGSYPGWFDGAQNFKVISRTRKFKESSEHLSGVLCLSQHHANEVSELVSCPVSVAHHPAVYDVPLWHANEGPYDCLQVGWWLRKLTSIYRLPPASWLARRIVLTGCEQGHYRRLLEQEAAAQDFKYRDSPEVVLFPRQQDQEYDKLLTRCVVLFDFWDLSASNLLMECIARATPVLCRRHAAAIEYLGAEYPLYFEDLEELASLSSSDVLAAHEYLLMARESKRFTEARFLEQVAAFSRLISADG